MTVRRTSKDCPPESRRSAATVSHSLGTTLVSLSVGSQSHRVPDDMAVPLIPDPRAENASDKMISFLSIFQVSTFVEPDWEPLSYCRNVRRSPIGRSGSRRSSAAGRFPSTACTTTVPPSMTSGSGSGTGGSSMKERDCRFEFPLTSMGIRGIGRACKAVKAH